MKNIFLYEDIGRKIDKIESSGIYNFGCSNLIGIDTHQIDKRRRASFVKSLNLREVHILQRWFAELIYHSTELGLFIKNIELTNISDSDEIGKNIYLDINEMLIQRQYINLLKYIIDLNKEYETEIKSLSFVYNGIQYRITSTGILESYTIDKDFQNFLNNNAFWSIISGQCK